MNQGNASRHRYEDGSRQDGGLFIHFPNERTPVGGDFPRVPVPGPGKPTTTGIPCTKRDRLSDGMQLGTAGGTITLLDAQRHKVHGVAYTADQANRAGWTIVF